MIGFMALNWLITPPVLQVDLEPDAATAAAMQQQLEQFDAQVWCISTLSSATAITSPEICWAMPAWISCIAWMRPVAERAVG